MTTRHSRATKVLHGALALAVGTQLLTSLIMQAPRPKHPGNVYFVVHEVSGLSAALFVLLFWGVVFSRKVGTDVGRLVPWFSAARRQALADDAGVLWRTKCQHHLLRFAEASPFSAALHGLGLLLMTAMAGTGLIYELASVVGFQDPLVVEWSMAAHSLLANLVWVYLIGHGLMALQHHYGGDQDLRVMWSLGRTEPSEGTEHGPQR